MTRSIVRHCDGARVVDLGHGSFVGCSECRARATSYVVGHGSFVGCRARATSYVVGHGRLVDCRVRQLGREGTNRTLF